MARGIARPSAQSKIDSYSFVHELTMPRPMPLVDDDTEPFWNATKEHRLIVQRCGECGAHRFPPSPLCPQCRSWTFDWFELDGKGTVYSWIVVRHAVTKGTMLEVPYAVALVDLEPGIRMPTRLVDCDVDSIVAGMPVVVEYIELTPEITLPTFRPVR